MEEATLHTRNEPVELLKVVIFGPESTGKTTLAQDLARHYETEWVPEYMRIYLEKKWNDNRDSIVRDDLVPIAKGQINLEKEISKKARDILICDTNLLELEVYSKYYYDDFVPEFIKNEATKREYDIYLLTFIDVPWEQDRLRDRPHNREEMFRLFEEALKIRNLPYHLMKGNREQRLETAVGIIDELKKKLSHFV